MRVDNSGRVTPAAVWAGVAFTVLLSAAFTARAGQSSAKALALAQRAGYSPVVPVPAEDSLSPDTNEPPNWLKTRPLPIANGKPIVGHETFRSRTLGLEVGYNIYLPRAYETEATRRFPVVYWLHGMNGNEYTNVGQAAVAHDAIESGQTEPFILVFVNGLGQSFYLDSPDGRYPAETLLVRELVPHIDGRLRTRASRSGRHLAGMSMGGFGALRIGFKYPELFASVVAYAGTFPTTDIARAPIVLEKMAGGSIERFEQEAPGALLESNVERIRERLAVRIVCGSQDRQLPSHRELSARLTQLRIDHDAEELSSFGHDIDGMFERAGVEGLRFALRAGAEAARDAVGIQVRDPLKVSRMVRVAYPPEARAARVEGRVVLEVGIGEDGAVTTVRVVSGPPALAGPASGTVRQWRFEPVGGNTGPTGATTEVTISFRLGS